MRRTLADRRLGGRLWWGHLHRYVTGARRCGYCGTRDYRYKSFATWGCYTWTTCRTCMRQGRAPFVDEHPPYFATKRAIRCNGCELTCGIDTRAATP